MPKKQSFYYVIMVPLSLLLLTGCPGVADYSVDLPGNFSVVRTSAHQVTIAQMSDTMWGENIIPIKVTEVAWDDKYIVAKQLGLKKDPNSTNGYVIPNVDDVHFWIVAYQTGEVFGPLEEESFSEKKRQLNISEDVVLKKIEDLR